MEQLPNQQNTLRQKKQFKFWSKKMSLEIKTWVTYNQKETLSTYIAKKQNYPISKEALFNGFKHRIKIESLKSFVV